MRRNPCPEPNRGNYTHYSPDPLTLVVDIPELDASKMPSRIAVGLREVESVRVASIAASTPA